MKIKIYHNPHRGSLDRRRWWFWLTRNDFLLYARRKFCVFVTSLAIKRELSFSQQFPECCSRTHYPTGLSAPALNVWGQTPVGISKSHTSNHQLHVVNSKSPTPSHQLQVTNSKSPTPNCQLQVTNSKWLRDEPTW